MAKDISLLQFINSLPSEDECLRLLFNHKYKNYKCRGCMTYSKYYRVKNRKCFECGKCGYQVYPLKGTILENSTIKIKSWLIAIYLIATDKVSARKVGFEIGVGYKTAWRMCHKIREMLEDKSSEKLSGIIEIDETYLGGRIKKTKANYKNFNPFKNKKIILGMYERETQE